MLRRLIDKLTQLKDRTGWHAAADELEAERARVRLILSDPQATQLGNDYASTIHAACQRDPSLNACQDDDAEFLSRLDDDTLLRLERQAEALEARMEELQRQQKRGST